MSVQVEKYCPCCSKYRPDEDRFNQELRYLGGFDPEYAEINFCPDCGSQLMTRPKHDDPGESQCNGCAKEVDSTQRFCVHCGHINPCYDYGHITLVRCRKCDQEMAPDDLIDDLATIKFCHTCGGELERADIAMSHCKCGNRLEPWLNFCEQCGEKNPSFKTDEKILEIFDADG